MVQKSCRIFLPRCRSRLVFLVFSLWILVLPQLAEARQFTDQINIHEAAPNENEITSHKHYTNKDGITIHSPSKSKSNGIPAGAYAQCRDGRTALVPTVEEPVPIMAE